MNVSINIKYYFIITFVGLVVYFIFSPRIENVKMVSGSSESEAFAVKGPLEQKQKTSPMAENGDLIKVENRSSTDDLRKNKKDNFMQFINTMSSCLDIRNTGDSSLAEPKIENILVSVQNELGEPVIRSEDWISTEIQNSDGERKLIKVETIYENDDIVKKLSYYKITEKGYVAIDLPEEQKIEPSVGLLASLESEGKVLKKEKSERIFFQNGEDLLYTEVDNELEYLEMNKSGKTLRCKDLSQAPCVCN